MDNYKYDEEEEIEEEKKEVDYDKFIPDKYFLRNIGLGKGLAVSMALLFGPTVIALTFIDILAVKNYALAITGCILLLGIFIFIAYINYEMGIRYEKHGGRAIISKPACECIFSMTKLTIFLLVCTIVPVYITKIELTIENTLGIIASFVIIYYVDVIITKILRHFKNLNANNDKSYHILAIIELIFCIITILGYGLVILPLAPNNHAYEIIIYIGFVFLLVVLFTFLGRIFNKKIDAITSENKEDYYLYNDDMYVMRHAFLGGFLLAVICIMFILIGVVLIKE